ncbi:MAG: hypothetical protein A3G52_04545 [Candidatus Taylorbacteria bacterium RIFCSPLOWO2_12_FULL_43_20]|uniref:Aminoglycoside phosphotransferase domain-containing protein n=1 Tax=Candidatus Taylorbacteria bacterium RIFCSPLOWO2_12_FULL_43_20 TaxID=1802332 RepID=A0A1G2NZ09_9BACT|nr:MAG: hypothetical protein A2825_00495 [Candidatus Taylorbacteria bacterium RIFCSPHIGHO2_01_FULL_43_120]OHA24016.1 MAG: hypothetical protein A3B98_00965 [Candidatus Taylorbacteria bacterium RIFCSPHIGHO2_02_FULL_43_55]OHA30471.1 MAG: hypothetical protein A3E92_02265 [Candidatus Taylorbacteria bacterium RIFCSPHIGHO2_12_FULL_42_34]OHA32135.1 MAG: hypothetical protein A3B09_00110 [Candidatus Taylorbacteria bacterium RIFCSPLOWO2_01_FULL_43_83]OHA39924.1 MAG: hypothetical protein A3H58_02280 [Candi
MLDRFLEENRLVIEKQFTEGSRCQGVYLVKKDHTPMILKISDIPSEMAEIERNLTGYRSTQELGLDFFVPEMFLAGQQGKFTFILMEYLGENFKSFMLRAGGIKDYMVLINCLRRVYQKSIHKINHEVLANQLDIFRELLKTSKHDSMANYPIREIDLERLIHMFDFTLRQFAFSCWDFQPDNLFLKNGVLKHADPQDKVIGIPVVDIGIIAGIIRDVEKLPKGDSGYELLFGFAIAEVGQLLELSYNQSQAFFHLARLLQLLKGVKYRHLEARFELANRFAYMAQERFQLLCSLLS